MISLIQKRKEDPLTVCSLAERARRVRDIPTREENVRLFENYFENLTVDFLSMFCIHLEVPEKLLEN